ncbi:MAG: triose-phosphate isomerase [Halorhabdus sp.]
MNLDYPYFQINFKVYPGTGGADGLAFANLIDEVAAETGTAFVLAPQIPDVRMIAEATDLPLMAPHMDALEAGRGMGKILPETIREAGAEAVVINHAENRDSFVDVERKIERAREAGLDSIVCVDSIEMGEAVAVFDPDAVIFEKPGDISTDRAITQTHPDRVEAFIEMMDEENPRTKVLVGGGISTPEDVRLAFEQGADATGAASAVSLADDPASLLRSIADAMP